MKKMKFVLLAAAGCLVLACDDERTTGNHDITGTYNLTAFNAPRAVDYDEDGVSSINLMEESRCFDDSRITINRDGTYILEENFISIQGTISFCDARVTKGTWTRSENSLTTTSDLDNDIVVNHYVFKTGNGMSGNTMTMITPNTSFPVRDGSGNPQSSSGTVGVTYTENPDNSY
ncbi:lipocalin family protein [Flavobacterium pallidum]|uniref:Lipocalin-like domain-containing protein n=1 Tax=Flavobacterium pallidum TaxID=2172098 RepID=A0A2S1SHD5_9FLAO|nr:lipocalin family protein [Flavobacterium pallidum]AWI25810.1 hypothetical protein HYN49_07785 [Flavobacterium pallidum]